MFSLFLWFLILMCTDMVGSQLFKIGVVNKNLLKAVGLQDWLICSILVYLEKRINKGENTFWVHFEGCLFILHYLFLMSLWVGLLAWGIALSSYKYRSKAQLLHIFLSCLPSAGAWNLSGGVHSCSEFCTYRILQTVAIVAFNKVCMPTLLVMFITFFFNYKTQKTAK